MAYSNGVRQCMYLQYICMMKDSANYCRETHIVYFPESVHSTMKTYFVNVINAQRCTPSVFSMSYGVSCRIFGDFRFYFVV